MTQTIRRVRSFLALCGLLLLVLGFQNQGLGLAATGRQESPAQPAKVTQAAAKQPSQDTSDAVVLPLNFERHTGDLPEMVKRRTIRALVILNPISFFYDNGLPQGITYEALQAFQNFVNQKLHTGPIKLEVTFLPLQEGQMEAALTQGMGDIIAYGVVVTPEREQRVAFSTPIETDVTQIIVTGEQYAGVSSFADLSGKEVYVNPLTVYGDNLRKVNEGLQKAGKAPIVIKAADKNLDDDDLIQMVNAGLLPATVTRKQRAQLWSQCCTTSIRILSLQSRRDRKLPGSCEGTIPS